MKLQVNFDFHTICKNLLSEKLDKLGVTYQLDSHGGVTILQELTEQQRLAVIKELNSSGLKVVNDEHMILVERIKEIISNLVREESFSDHTKVSEHLEKELHYSYSHLSKIFSQTAYISIEKFVILRKIDYVKELLIDYNLNLTEIAYKLNYSSVSHLSRQFKKATGFSPTYFMNLKEQLKSN